MVTYYSYTLLDGDDEIFMSTLVNEPNPMIDKEFWDKFMEGGVRMEYLGEIGEEEEDE
jgi:hypothetical protein